jgi:hypothetical protein
VAAPGFGLFVTCDFAAGREAKTFLWIITDQVFLVQVEYLLFY